MAEGLKPFPKSGMSLFMAISPDGTLKAGGTVHALSNPVLFDRAAALAFEMWGSYNATVQHEYEASGKLLALGCDRQPQGGLATMRSAVAELRDVVQRVMCLVAASVTPGVQQASSEDLIAQLRKAGMLMFDRLCCLHL